LPAAAGERLRVRRGGFPSREAAAAALDELSSPAGGPGAGLLTGEWLAWWLGSRVSLRPSTARSYEAHIRCYLVPYLGGIPLVQLTAGDVQAMFTAITRDEAALGHPMGAATLRRIHATLRAALNGAVRAGLITTSRSSLDRRVSPLRPRRPRSAPHRPSPGRSSRDSRSSTPSRRSASCAIRPRSSSASARAAASQRGSSSISDLIKRLQTPAARNS
jgi:hypothetical protein